MKVTLSAALSTDTLRTVNPHQPFNFELYGDLLKEAKPGIIDSEEEHDRLLTIAENYMERGGSLIPEERKLLELIVFLIQDFERSVENSEREDDEDDDGNAEVPEPHLTLQRLLDGRGLQLADVADIFGNSYNAELVLAGKKPISRGQAKALGKYFKVPDKLFLTVLH
jgi:HTH-type transcriptional regulator / antitoxin HigA